MRQDFTPERIRSDGLELAYLDVGSGSETVIFSHSYLVNSQQFEAQVEALASTCRVIAYDHRDHGRSDRADGPYGLYDLVDDGEKVIAGLDAAPCHWVGLSTGGFVGMRLALRHPEWFRSLTLMDTSGEAEVGLEKLRNRTLVTLLRLVGVKPLIGQALKTMFGDPFLKEEEFRESREFWRTRILANDRHALIRFGNAILARDDVLDGLGALDLPVLVIAGELDRAMAVKHGRAIAGTVPGATLSLIEKAGHLCTIEQPTAVNDVLVPFIQSHSPGP